MFKPKEYPRLCCKVCGGLMHTTAPRDLQDISIHFYCGSKLPQGANDGVFHVPQADNSGKRLL